MRVERYGSIIAAALLMLATSAYAAEGNQLVGFGAVQKSLGGAGAASPQDSTWIVTNPASLADLGRRIDASFELLNIRVEVEPKGSPLLANPLAGKMDFTTYVPIPTFGMVWPLDEDINLGFGMIGTAGNRTDFDRPRSTLALFTNGDRRADDEVARFPIGVSYRFDNGWAVGGAIIPAYIKFRTDSLTLKLRPTKGDNRYDYAYGAGFELGVYKKWDKWSFGAAYTSRTWMTSFPLYEHDLTKWSLDLPQQIQIGLGYQPIESVQLMLDYKWIDWDEIRLYGRNAVRGGLGWNTEYLVKGGVVWDINEAWTVRGGFSIGNPVVDTSHAFVNMLTPAVAEVHLGTGFSYRMNEHSAIHMSYEMTIPETRTENGKGDLFSVLGKGSRVTFAEHSLTLQYSYEF